jgi:hypothetical protein
MSEHRSEAEERSSKRYSAPGHGADAAGVGPMSEHRSEAEERSSKRYSAPVTGRTPQALAPERASKRSGGAQLQEIQRPVSG